MNKPLCHPGWNIPAVTASWVMPAMSLRATEDERSAVLDYAAEKQLLAITGDTIEDTINEPREDDSDEPDKSRARAVAHAYA